MKYLSPDVKMLQQVVTSRRKIRLIADATRIRNARELRLDVLRRYGNQCACCSEKHIEFLCIDHINGDGAKHRKTFKSTIYRWLKNNNYPKDNFRILCHNCNMALGFYGYCPHKHIARQ